MTLQSHTLQLWCIVPRLGVARRLVTQAWTDVGGADGFGEMVARKFSEKCADLFVWSFSLLTRLSHDWHSISDNIKVENQIQ